MAIPLQIACDADVATPGSGLTVTVIRDDAPVQPPPLEVGVTLYTMYPGVVLLALFKVLVITVPGPPPVPPDKPPVFATVQLKLLEVLETRLMVSGDPLHTDWPPFDTDGAGLTLTVTTLLVPRHVPVMDVGVTVY